MSAADVIYGRRGGRVVPFDRPACSAPGCTTACRPGRVTCSEECTAALRARTVDGYEQLELGL